MTAILDDGQSFAASSDGYEPPARVPLNKTLHTKTVKKFYTRKKYKIRATTKKYNVLPVDRIVYCIGVVRIKTLITILYIIPTDSVLSRERPLALRVVPADKHDWDDDKHRMVCCGNSRDAVLRPLKGGVVVSTSSTYKYSG